MRAFVTPIIVFLCLAITSCTQCGKKSEQTEADAKDSDKAVSEQVGGKLEIVDLVAGSGEEAVDGKRVTVHYTGDVT